MNLENIIEKCQASQCDSWQCIFYNYSQTITFFAALIGLLLSVLIVLRFWKAAVADIGLGIAGMLAMAILLLSLPSVTKISLSFAPQQSVLLEFKSTSSANDVCTTQNLITVSSKPLIERISILENKIKNSSYNQNNLQNKNTELSNSDEDVRIYYRDGQKDAAEKLLSALRVRFPIISTYNTDLTEIGQIHKSGFARVRYEYSPKSGLRHDAIWIKDETSRALGIDVAGPDSVKSPLPGDIQILLY